MKTLILTSLAIVTTLSANAQLFGPESLNGAFWGSFIGGLAAGNRHHGFSGEGAAIGAGVGLVAGAIAGESRRYDYYDSPGYAYYPSPAVSVGCGYGRRGSSAYVYYAPNRYCAPGYYYQPTQYYQPARPNYAVGGTLLGAASGALIGASQHDASKGAAIGAGAGLVLGAIAEHSAQRHEQKAAAQVQNYTPAPQPTVSSEGEAPRRTETPAQNQITSKPAANSTYYWTAPPKQISDAPRVPDAPSF